MNMRYVPSGRSILGKNCALGLEFVLQTEDDGQRKIIWFA